MTKIVLCFSPCRLVYTYKTSIVNPTGNCYKGDGQNNVDCKNAVETIADLLKSAKQKFDDIRLPKVRIPMLQVVHRNTGTQVDIWTRNGMGVETARLMR